MDTKSFSAGLNIIDKTKSAEDVQLVSFSTLSDVEMCEKTGYYLIKKNEIEYILETVKYKLFFANVISIVVVGLIFLLISVTFYVYRKIQKDFQFLTQYNSYIKYNVALSKHSLDSLNNMDKS